MKETTQHNKEFYSHSNKEQEKANHAASKQNFFANLNNILVKSGILAKGIEAANNYIHTQVEQAQSKAKKDIAILVCAATGLLFVIHGIIFAITRYYEIGEWTSLITGGIFILIAGVVYLTK
jgi:hypothetical protein